MATDGTEEYPGTADRIVAEFGDGHDGDGIASRYGLTVAQVYAVVERQVGPAEQPYPVSAHTGQEQSCQPSPGLPDDVIVAEYGEGYDVEAIARKHGISVDRVYEVVRRVVQDDPPPPVGPTSSW